ncbi:putative manganese-dependent inorganic diphosphatase [Cerasicoccus arenae]|uniref:inorganic diphosphatase n=1 Tax=Cerasicoccus arenae TaxID=424488 RepID=A0A8J3D8U8_9BACT|nr:putative manganese-dependent inorganic diphosphatase [Cerasicoccus arenae]MBK1856995.1 putative manganese-dependent inorganic diphosphatase [Cerasicoccus arenae]GHB90292.1 manganese-dependent inorganic pyrophosphatase [Cerasicoccus arenae]
MTPTYIIGHKNPDADAICSAIAYAAYKGAIGEKGFIAARCGNSNARIDAILRRFDLPLPLFMGDVTPRVHDIMRRDIHRIGRKATCAEALEIIDEHDIRALPVVEENGQLAGQVSIFSLGEFFIPKPNDPRKMRHVLTSIGHIIRSLKAEVLNVVDPELTQDLYVRVGAMDIRSFGAFTETEGITLKESVVVVGDRYDIQQKAIQGGARLLVITGGLDVEDEVVEFARDRGVSLIISAADSATTSWIIRTATLLEPMINCDVPTFGSDEKVMSVKRKIATQSAPIFCVVDENKKLIGLFSKADLLKPVPTRLVLVDHNELGQAVNGAGEVNIVEIIDHHRLANPATAQPIFFRNEIIGSTSSIIASLYQSAGIQPTPAIAGIMMAGLISDTLNLQSPTSTQKDADLLPWLASIAGVTIEEIADLVFNSGSIILTSSADRVIETDCKQYDQGSIRYSVSQIEELGYENFWKHSGAIESALDTYRESNQLDFSCLLVTDINQQNSLLLTSGDSDINNSISFSHVDNHSNIFDMPSIVSRKKQLIPYISNLLDSMGVEAL